MINELLEKLEPPAANTFDATYSENVRRVYRYQAALEALERVCAEPWEYPIDHYEEELEASLAHHRYMIGLGINVKRAEQQVSRLNHLLSPERRRERRRFWQIQRGRRVELAERHVEDYRQVLEETGLL